MTKRSRDLLAVAMAFLAGWSGLLLFFSDPRPGEPLTARLLGQGLIMLVAGVVVGWLTRWWPAVCAGLAWGGLVTGAMLVLLGELRGAAIVAVSFCGALAGGLVGSVFRARRLDRGAR